MEIGSYWPVWSLPVLVLLLISSMLPCRKNSGIRVNFVTCYFSPSTSKEILTVWVHLPRNTAKVAV